MSTENRRTFIKESLTKSLIAVNATTLAGLIGAPGIVQAAGGTTTTAPILDEIKFEGTNLGAEMIVWSSSAQSCRAQAFGQCGNQICIQKAPLPTSSLAVPIYTGGTVTFVSTNNYKLTLPSGAKMTCQTREPGA